MAKGSRTGRKQLERPFQRGAADAILGNVSVGSTNAIDPKQLLMQAAAFLRAGKFADAEALCRRLVDRDGSNSDALHLLGIVALQTERPAEAHTVLARAARRDKKNPDLYSNLASALLSLDRVDEGVTALKRALKLAPAHPLANYNMGLIALRQGRYSRAGRHLEKTLKAIPQHIDALVALGTSQVQMSMPEKKTVPQF